MSVIITQIGSAISLDVEPYLLESENIQLDQVYEDGAFARQIEDVHLIVSNQSGALTTLFADKPATTRYSVRIVDDGRTLFVGEVKHNMVAFDPKNEKVDFTAFSNLKSFWDRCKESQIQPEPRRGGIESSTVYTTVEYILKREFIFSFLTRRGGTDVSERFGDLFRNLIIDADYKDRPIRGWENASAHTDPTVGDNGRYRELAGSTYGSRSYRDFGSTRGGGRASFTGSPVGQTTCFDLLTAFAFYYNAEFYIDYDANALVMHRRNAVIISAPKNGLPHDIDAVLMDKESMKVMLLDDDKHDYVRVAYYNAPPALPIVRRLEGLTHAFGLTKNVAYVVTEVYKFEQSDTEFETGPSAPLHVDIESMIGDPIIFGLTVSVYVHLDLPASVGAYKKRIYKTKQGGGDFFLLNEFSNPNQLISIIDSTGDIFLNPSWMPPAKSQVSLAWLHYDEATGQWDVPIRDTFEGANAPEGKTIDLVPALSFREIGSPKLKQQSATDIVAFFGLEALKNEYQTNIERDYLDLFITRHKATCTVSGIGFKIGDAAISNAALQPLQSTPLMIKRARNYLSPMNRKTELEMITA